MDQPKTSWTQRILIPHREPFLRELLSLRFLISLVILMLVSSHLGHLWVFEYPGFITLDAFAANSPAKTAKYCRIVKIDSEDYNQYFGGVSPLDHDKLKCAIEKLLELGPAVIVVDFDTSAAKFADLTSLGDRIVWARGADVDAKGRVTPQPVLGVQSGPFMSGLALFPRDPDWTVRESPRYVLANGKDPMPTLPWAAVEDFCRTTSAAPCPTIQKLSATPDGEGGVLDLQVFRNRYKFDSLNLQDLVFADKTGQQACVSAWQGQKPSLDNPLKDEIVFLGGYYSTGDVHPTPFGTQPGVELVAAAAEADLGPSNSTEMGTVGMYFLKILLGIGVAACLDHDRRHSRDHGFLRHLPRLLLHFLSR
jgi:CHASE2 domain-containing sensor protein